MWSWAAPAIVAIAVSACTNTQQPPVVAAPATSTPEQVQAQMQALAAAVPAPPSAEFDRPPLIQASLSRGALRPGVSTGNPQLMGLERSRVVEALGRPRLSRREASAEVLTFSGGECSLFVFLYDGPDGVGVVRHVEARARQSLKAVSDANCVDSVMRRKVTTSDPA